MLKKKTKISTCQLVSIDLSCLPLFCNRRAAKQASFISVIISFESCTECKILFKLAGHFGHGHAINEPLIDNNFMNIFCNFMVEQQMKISCHIVKATQNWNIMAASGCNCTCLLASAHEINKLLDELLWIPCTQG